MIQGDTHTKSVMIQGDTCTDDSNKAMMIQGDTCTDDSNKAMMIQGDTCTDDSNKAMMIQGDTCTDDSNKAMMIQGDTCTDDSNKAMMIQGDTCTKSVMIQGDTCTDDSNKAMMIQGDTCTKSVMIQGDTCTDDSNKAMMIQGDTCTDDSNKAVMIQGDTCTDDSNKAMMIQGDTCTDDSNKAVMIQGESCTDDNNKAVMIQGYTCTKSVMIQGDTCTDDSNKAVMVQSDTCTKSVMIQGDTCTDDSNKAMMIQGDTCTDDSNKAMMIQGDTCTDDSNKAMMIQGDTCTDDSNKAMMIQGDTCTKSVMIQGDTCTDDSNKAMMIQGDTCTKSVMIQGDTCTDDSNKAMMIQGDTCTDDSNKAVMIQGDTCTDDSNKAVMIQGETCTDDNNKAVMIQGDTCTKSVMIQGDTCTDDNNKAVMIQGDTCTKSVMIQGDTCTDDSNKAVMVQSDTCTDAEPHTTTTGYEEKRHGHMIRNSKHFISESDEMNNPGKDSKWLESNNVKYELSESDDVILMDRLSESKSQGSSHTKSDHNLECSDCDNGSDIADKITKSVQKMCAIQDIDTLFVNSTHIEFLWTLYKKYKTNRGKWSDVRHVMLSNNFLLVLHRLMALIDMHRVQMILNPTVSVWQSIKQLISLTWVMSDVDADLCTEIIKSDSLVKLFLKFLEFLSVVEIQKTTSAIFFVKFLLGCLHNCLRHTSETRCVLRGACAVDVLQSVLKTYRSYAMIKVKTLIVLSYIVDESQSNIVTAADPDLQFLLAVLQDAVQSPDHLSVKFGMNVPELLKGLNNLAVNDGNKVKLMEHGILRVLVQVLKVRHSVEEVLLTVTGLWKLSFHHQNRQLMREDTDFLQVLHSTNHYKNEAVHHAVLGVLWELQEKQTTKNIEVEAQVNCPHIMISYQWDSQGIMLKVKDRLKQHGYKVWMDVEHMTGSTLEAMSLAVEKSAVVLISMSQKYKDSPSCRSEAEYTYKLRKSFIPLRVESNYNPDGWLGMLIGTKLYFDFYEDDKFETMMRSLVKELGDRGKLSTYMDRTDGQIVRPNIPVQQISGQVCQEPNKFVCWTSDDVKSWLQNLKHVRGNTRLNFINGQLLAELKYLQEKVPDYFYTIMKSEFEMNILSVLHFSSALRSL